MKLTVADKIAFAALTALLMFRAVPTNAGKAAGGLRLSRPIETPDFVQLSWTGGTAEATYTISRSADGGETWTPLVTGLSGASGTWFFHGFTLDRDYQYRIIVE
jgi:hypothetical protein